MLEETKNILGEILNERIRQNNKWGEQNHSPLEWMIILMEEVGEASRNTLQHHFSASEYAQPMNNPDPEKELAKYRYEMIQVAAVATSAVESLDRQARDNEL